MSRLTSIEWTDHTFNIAWGCHEVSPGCDNCYARTLAERWGHKVWGPPKNTPRRVFGPAHWDEPLKWNREAEREGRRRRVFCSSMADVWEAHPTLDAEREKLWPLIRATEWLDWQLLTKRIERVPKRLPADWGPKGYPNVWIGTSVESQEQARRAWILVRDVVAPVLFLSVEPMLGPVDLTMVEVNEDTTVDVTSALGWVICGGESGSRRRPMEVEWAEGLRAQCGFAGVPFFMKQASATRPGTQGELPDELWATKEMPGEVLA